MVLAYGNPWGGEDMAMKVSKMDVWVGAMKD